MCQKFILWALGVSKARIIRISKVLLTGGTPKELRGGDRVSRAFEATKENIRSFIKKLRGTESHYTRLRTRRIYLSPELSISKLHKLYNVSCTSPLLKAKYAMFNKIFVNEFNIGFRSPASDVCSYCLRLTLQIKSEQDRDKKVRAITEKRIHKLRANAFYDLLKKQPEKSISCCFDMQQVQPLPKTPIGEAFYLRQINYYTLCCVRTNSKYPVFYTWTEDLAGRGSVEVSSGILDYLRNLEIGSDVTSLRLFSDGCGGQNKNSHMVHTLLFWLHNESRTVTKIQLTFPVRGHSFLPADRLFGRVEQKLRKEAVIENKEKYHEIYKEIGSLKILGIDWKLYNTKALETVYKKVDKISDCKRIVLEKVETNGTISTQIECFVNFKSSFGSNQQKLLKRGKSVGNYRLPELPLKKGINIKKIANLRTLLTTHFGSEWEQQPHLHWYKGLLSENIENVEDNDDENPVEEACDCLEEDVAIHV